VLIPLFICLTVYTNTLGNTNGIWYTVCTMKTVKKVFEYELPIIMKKEKGGYFAYSPSWKDCYAQGDTVDEVSSEIVTVAQTLIDIHREEGLPIPLRKVKERSLLTDFSFTLPVVVSST